RGAGAGGVSRRGARALPARGALAARASAEAGVRRARAPPRRRALEPRRHLREPLEVELEAFVGAAEAEALVEAVGVDALFVRRQLHADAAGGARTLDGELHDLGAEAATAQVGGDTHGFDLGHLRSAIAELLDDRQLQRRDHAAVALADEYLAGQRVERRVVGVEGVGRLARAAEHVVGVERHDRRHVGARGLADL